MKGASPEDAFKPWTLADITRVTVEQVRDDIRTHGIASMSCLGVELELRFQFKGTCVHGARATLWSDGAEAWIEAYRSTEAVKPVEGVRLPFEYKDDLAVFATVGPSFLAGRQSRYG